MTKKRMNTSAIMLYISEEDMGVKKRGAANAAVEEPLEKEVEN